MNTTQNTGILWSTIIIFIILFIIIIIVGILVFRAFSRDEDNLIIMLGSGVVTPQNNLFFKVITGTTVTIGQGIVSYGNVIRINNRTGAEIKVIAGSGVMVNFGVTEYIANGLTASFLNEGPNTWLRF